MPSLPTLRRSLPTAGLPALAVAGLLAAAARPAAADLTEFVWFGPDDYAVRVTHMPDFDQRRVPGGGLLGLPGGGNMYCVPTSVLNLAGYAANHGAPTVIDSAWWQGQAVYPDVTELLRILGVIGNTTIAGGTNLNGMRDQAEALFPASHFTVTVDGASFWWAPKVDDLAEMVRNGGIVSFCHGWYVADGNLVDRDGGHCITFTRGYDDIFRQEVWVRDPADVPSDAVQSPFVERTYTFEDSIYVTLNDGIKRMSRIRPNPGDGAIRLIDGYCLVRPKYAASFGPGGSGLVIDYAATLFEELPDTLEFDPPGDVSAILSGPAHSALYAAIQAVGGGSTLWCTTILDPEWIELPVPLPPNPYLALAGDRSLLVLGGGQLQQILLDADVPDVIASIPAPIDGRLAVDRRSGRTFVLDQSAGRLFQYGRELGDLTGLYSIPGPIPSDGVSIDWDESRDGLWLLDPALPGQARLARPVPGSPEMNVETAELPGLVEPVLLQADDAGTLMIVDEDVWKAFVQDVDGTWSRDVSQPFDGKPADKRSFISTGRTNYDPEVHGTEAWRNVLPESFGEPVADCLADVTLDGTVGFDDVLAALAAWGPCPDGTYCEADVDGDGETGFGDVLVILAAWGDCP